MLIKACGKYFIFHDYFTKWVEVASLTTLTKKHVLSYLKHNIRCLYGLPHSIITYNARSLNNHMMDALCAQFRIFHHNSVPYSPKMNGTIEAANKNVKRILQKMTLTYKDWHEKFPFALYAYRTPLRRLTCATMYSPVYRMKAVLLVDVKFRHCVFWWKLRSKKRSGSKQDMTNSILSRRKN